MNTSSDERDRQALRRMQEAMLLGRRVAGDRLMLDDATLRAALDGSRPLTAGERAALQGSPLTARRLRTLAIERRAAQAAGTADAWRGSAGMLRAASSGMPGTVTTDDGWWTLHFIDLRTFGWRVVLQLAPQAPFAEPLLVAQLPLRVLDGAGATILAGQLDADGECEATWPFATAPDEHLQAHGARFTVAPLEGNAR